MKKNVRMSVLAMMSAMMLSSCATIVTGTTPSVTIEGDVEEPVTIKTSYLTYENVMLPVQVKLKRKHLDGQRIEVTSENYSFQDLLVRKSVNEWAFGNILIGGLIGWGIDLLTNAVSRPADSVYKVDAQLKNQQ